MVVFCSQLAGMEVMFDDLTTVQKQLKFFFSTCQATNKNIGLLKTNHGLHSFFPGTIKDKIE